MATQSATVSRAAASGASQSSGLPGARAAATDYSLTDLELLGVIEQPEETAERPQAGQGSAADLAAGKGTAGAREEHAAPQKTSDAALHQDAEEPDPPASLQEFAPAFALPGVGPKLREICERESAYRQAFPTVEEARAVREVFPGAAEARAAAQAQTELGRLDALVESRDPRAHAELLAGLQRLAPESIRSLALAFAAQLPAMDVEASRQVMQLLAARVPQQSAAAPAVEAAPAREEPRRTDQPDGRSPAAQLQAAPFQRAQAAQEFLRVVNHQVENVLRETVAQKVAELMPDAPEGARQNMGGEIFRELDLALRADPELQEQVRESVHNALQGIHQAPAAHAAWRDADSPAAPQREIVARLIARRARAALPSVAKRVVADWTETVLRSNQSRRARQSEAASRTEIGRGGTPAPVPARPRRVDYQRMSDEEILNME